MGNLRIGSSRAWQNASLTVLKLNNSAPVNQATWLLTDGLFGALFKQNKFVMPSNTNYDTLQKEPQISKLLIKMLNPEEGDAIIIGSDDMHKKRSELAAKNAALFTMMNHEKHNV